MKIILINGPPGAGKDFTGDILLEQLADYGCRSGKYKMTTPMDKALIAFFGITEEEYASVREGPDKELPSSYFFGATCRKLLQTFSEWWVKKLCGSDVFGQLACRHMKLMGVDVICITDSGFNCEVEPIIAEFGVNNVIGLRMHRHNHSYEGDTREYLRDDLGIPVLDLTNTGVEEDLVAVVASNQVLQDWIQDAVSVV